jgi:hypothetical protein
MSSPHRRPDSSSFSFHHALASSDPAKERHGRDKRHDQDACLDDHASGDRARSPPTYDSNACSSQHFLTMRPLDLCSLDLTNVNRRQNRARHGCDSAITTTGMSDALSCIDEADMRERLGEIAQHDPFGWVVLL